MERTAHSTRELEGIAMRGYMGETRSGITLNQRQGDLSEIGEALGGRTRGRRDPCALDFRATFRVEGITTP